ncbi:MAG: sterol desaturase family protein [Cyclobacteriaceae bacterium]|nr:sterol desaturase family protein [Cyclobacteriaceae bacterium]
METYVAALNYAIPFFISLIVVEKLAASIMKKEVIRGMDTLSSLSSGLTNVIKDVLGLTVTILSYEWMVEHLAVWQVSSSWLVVVLAFIGLDFAGYWVHRISHQVNYFWNHHLIHHSSEEFNLGCALRQSISDWFSLTFIFLLPIALLGVPARVVALIAPIHLFMQFWYHTRLIGRMGLLEKILVTPSHHRVHHAINKEYLDKNLSQVFIVWDHLFGTFQEELADVPCVYGVKRPVRTWNPIIINFLHLWQLIRDAWHAQRYVDKVRIWFMPTGWRPADVVARYPVEVIEDVYRQQKYAPSASWALQGWSWLQYVVNFAFMMLLFNHLSQMVFGEMVAYGAFLFLSVYSFTMLMDRSPASGWVELMKSVLGLTVIVRTGDWLYVGDRWPAGVYAVGAYFVLSALVVLYFSRMDRGGRSAILSEPV